MLKFVFDLDGTLTRKETLPFIASHFGLKEQITELTREAVEGTTPFIESFISRVNMMRDLPVAEVSALLAQIPLYEVLIRFIRRHRAECLIATGNLHCWIDGLIRKIGCNCRCSEALVRDNKIVKITSILDKASLVQNLRDIGHKVVYIGDSNNDMEAMRLADVAIVVCLASPPPPPLSLQTVGDYLFLEEERLCHFLEQLY